MGKTCLNFGLVTAIFVVALAAFAEENLTPPSPPTTTAALNNQFELIDGAAQITGEPDNLSTPAHKKWQKACDDWKSEFKEFNKTNQIITLSCNSPTCSSADGANTICTSTATYKIKTSGVLVRPATPPAPPEPPKIMAPAQPIEVAPPPPIIEVVPPVRVGFIWVRGYWGWEGHRHLWLPGHWVAENPGYVWRPERWHHRERGWHFEEGRWEKIH